MADPQARLNEMIDNLREHGCRMTPQRLAVLKILAASKEHPSVEKIYERIKANFPMTSLATIYKTVTLLKELGEVLELGFGDDSNRYDGNNPHPHPHLICIKCKNIVDPDVAILNELHKKMAQETGYRIINHRLDFFGICPECQDTE